MHTMNIAEKTMGALEVRRQFGKLLQGVLVNGEKVLVERNGEQVAAIVPLRVYTQWKQDRAAFFADMRALAQQSNLTINKADSLAQEAVQAARRPAQTV